MVDWLYINMAIQWLNGYPVSTTSRDYIKITSPEAPGATTLLEWMVFDSIIHDCNYINGHYGHANAAFGVPTAVSKYRVPDIIVKIGQKKELVNKMTNGIYDITIKEASFFSESYPNKDYDPDGFKWVYKQSYLSKNGIFGTSSHLEEPGKIVGVYPYESWMTQRWLLKWTLTDKNQSILYQNATGIFFRENLIEEPDNIKQTENEQVIQYKSTMIGIYNQKDYNYTNGTFGQLPQYGYNSLINITSNKINYIFGDYGKIYIVIIYVNDNLIWEYNTDNSGFIMINLWWNCKQNGIILDVVESQEFNGDFGDFIDFIIQNAEIDFDKALEKENNSVNYYSPINKANISITHDGKHIINGKQVIYDDKWPLLSYVDGKGNEIVNQQQYGDILNIKTIDENCQYDFKQFTTTCK